MKKFLGSGFLLIFALTSFAFADSKPENARVKKRQFQDGTLISLGNEVILWSELKEAEKIIKLGAVEKGLFYPSVLGSKTSHKAFDTLINEKLIKIYCEKMKIELPESAVSDRIKSILDSPSSGVSTIEDLEKQLILEGQTLEAFKKRLSKDLLFQRFYQSVIAPLVSDLEKEVERQSVLDKNKQELTVVSLKRVAMSCPEGKVDCSEVLEKLKEAKKSFDSGKKFDQVIKEYSAATDNSLDIAEYSLADIGVSKLKEALSELEEGRVTQPIEINKTFYLFQLVKKEHKKDPKFMAKVREKIFRKKFREWLKDRRAEVYIPSDYDKILAKSKS